MEEEDNNHSNDFIIDEGFPVLNNFHYLLRKSKESQKKEKAEKDGTGDCNAEKQRHNGEMHKNTDPIPRHQFASYANALSMNFPSQRKSFLEDCATVFTARTREDSEGYSSGSTFFLPCGMKPRCALEGLAERIFKAHVDGLEWEVDEEDEAKTGEGKTDDNEKTSWKKKLLYDPERSGAEWWTLVLDTPSDNKPAKKTANGDEEDDDDEEDDEVGMHFDADYGLEEQVAGMMVHPRVATVTYLSDTGVPTLILDKKSPPMSDPERKSLNGDISKGWLSHPSFGKHVAFDGRLLHGAPGEYFPAVVKKHDGSEEPKAKKMKVDQVRNGNGDDNMALGGKRITFLVNVWLNHCPIDAEILDEEIVEKLTTPWQSAVEQKESNLKEGDPIKPGFEWKLLDVSNPDALTNTCTINFASVDSDGPAGDEDVVICKRHVNFGFGASKEDLHAASKMASTEGSMEMELCPKVLTLTVGDECVSSDEEDDNSDEDN
mmetsp:Transcript_26803/g.55137  ORF Transcript_26803/g.55137 Transcript_26803/m.55137 type:complete len:489 (+) Transcript_26803:45-1511(+)|eukprot:CAMPEP_0171395682 /NCGR_PEP_ID=MMETSP0880-20121228/4109_1 /TAXON_ID=67004 /ORGANISM="Thalassiosira weissflogii, Strain CCMP1336" /LENGTH=488 /DNA_ID=CAMNT_0011909199 /DNA_START=26 /DNA_END=1492 /DNA_ORIENTATION=+